MYSVIIIIIFNYCICTFYIIVKQFVKIEKEEKHQKSRMLSLLLFVSIIVSPHTHTHPRKLHTTSDQ